MGVNKNCFLAEETSKLNISLFLSAGNLQLRLEVQAAGENCSAEAKGALDLWLLACGPVCTVPVEPSTA